MEVLMVTNYSQAWLLRAVEKIHTGASKTMVFFRQNTCKVDLDKLESREIHIFKKIDDQKGSDGPCIVGELTEIYNGPAEELFERFQNDTAAFGLRSGAGSEDFRRMLMSGGFLLADGNVSAMILKIGRATKFGCYAYDYHRRTVSGRPLKPGRNIVHNSY